MSQRSAAKIRHSLGLALVLLAASASCSVLLKEDPQQCKSDNDCTSLGFTGATCNVTAGVCVRGTAGSAGADSAGSAGQAGSSNGGSAGSGTMGGSANGGMSQGGSTNGGSGGEAGIGEGGATFTCPSGDCNDPVTVRVVESSALPAYQPPGLLLGVEQFHTDVCPQDQILTGFTLWFGTDSASNKFLLNTQAICAVPSLTVTSPHKFTLDTGVTLPKRGSETNLISSVVVQCLPGQIVVGWNGVGDSKHIYQYALRCSKPSLTETAGVYSLTLGATASVAPPAGTDTGAATIPPQDCPAGFVARGSNTRLSNAFNTPQRLERFGLVCGRLALTYQTGAPCKTDGECDSGACTNHICAASTCHAGFDCKCERLDTRDYEFCSDAVTFAQAALTSGCGADKMRLVKIEDGIENGWLFSTGLLHFPAASNSAGVWIGATDNDVEGKWVWLDAAQTQFWQGLSVFDNPKGSAVGNLYSAWKLIPGSDEPNNGLSTTPLENCGVLDINGGFGPDDRWIDTKCADARPYACEFEDGR